MQIFDAHLDLAYLAEAGRDMGRDLDSCGGPHPPAAVTFPSLRAGGVSACLGTIFTQAVPDPAAPNAATGTYTYRLGDAEGAHRAGLRQLERYHRWASEGVIELMPQRGARSAAAVGAVGAESPLRVGILMECADPIASPDDLGFWVERGVVAIGLAWVHGGRYAAGNAADPGDPGAGLTDLGRALVRAMDDLGVVHDLSHLSQRATDELLEMSAAPVMASHSNCRALFDRDAAPNARQRHLADSTIREIARRGGVIGINLFSDFLEPGIAKGGSARREWVRRHIAHIVEVSGTWSTIGLGTDMDGGFGADRLPDGTRTPSDLAGLLAEVGDQLPFGHGVESVALGNWARFWAWGG